MSDIKQSASDLLVTIKYRLPDVYVSASPILGLEQRTSPYEIDLALIRNDCDQFVAVY